MASLLSKVIKFARSPQGQKLIKQAEHIAEDPKRRKQAEEILEKVEKKA
jgi:hypothetical protein